MKSEWLPLDIPSQGKKPNPPYSVPCAVRCEIQDGWLAIQLRYIDGIEPPRRIQLDEETQVSIGRYSGRLLELKIPSKPILEQSQLGRAREAIDGVLRRVLLETEPRRRQPERDHNLDWARIAVQRAPNRFFNLAT